MKQYLRIIINNCHHDIDLSIIREQHIHYITRLNQPSLFFHCQIKQMAEKLTEVLFTDQEYIINWVNKNLAWKKIAPYFILTSAQWQKSKKYLF